MAQATIKKEIVQKKSSNSIDFDLLVLKTLKVIIKEKPKKIHKNKEGKLKKINKTLLKIAKKSKYNSDYIRAITPFKRVGLKLVYRNYVLY